MGLLHDADEPVYTISVAARLLKVRPSLLRQYEDEGLIRPSRTQGRTRLYSINDLELAKKVVELHQGKGVNVAGVQTILGSEVEEREEPE